MHRRQFIHRALYATAAACLPAACRHARPDDLTMALGWLPDVEYADLWVAIENGYLKDEGLHFHYLPGGPNAPQPVLEISARQATFGDSDWLPFLDAIAQGNDFVILASLFPVLPTGLISLPTHPIHSPQDLSNLRFLVQGPAERNMLQALFRINHLAETYTMIPVGFSPEPLLQHAGDAYFCFVINQPQTLIKMGLRQGKDFYVTRLYDLGYKVSTGLLTVERSTLERRRPQLVRFLRALLRGHYANAANPSYGAHLAVDKYGADLGLDLDQQTTLNQLLIPFETAEGTQIPFWISQQIFTGPMYAVARASGRTKLPAPSRLYDMTLLEEAWHSLKKEEL